MPPRRASSRCAAQTIHPGTIAKVTSNREVPEQTALNGCRVLGAVLSRYIGVMSNDEGSTTIRPMRVADAEEVANIWSAGWRDGHLGHVPDELLAVRTMQSFRERASRRVGDTVVALIDDALVGFVMVVDDEVEQVYVVGHQRGTAVAAVLLAEAERLVRAGGHQRAWLAVVAGNERARRFYHRNGWIDEGLFDYPAASAAGPISVPCHRYVKQVTGPAGQASGSE